MVINYTTQLAPNRKYEDKLRVLPIDMIGGADGIRTHYLLTASQTLSQLSYSPTPESLAKKPNKLNHLCSSSTLVTPVVIAKSDSSLALGTGITSPVLHSVIARSVSDMAISVGKH